MRPLVDSASQGGKEDGFTLVETLIALVILAISAGFFVQSVALATGQIRSAARLESAELLALTVIAERTADGNEHQDAFEGMDAVSGLHWSFVRERHPRIIDEAARAGASLFIVEIRESQDSPPLYQLRAAEMEATAQ